MQLFCLLAASGASLLPQVHFVNAQGVPEAGIDHGGLMKELLEQVVAAGCQPEYGLFAATEGSNMMYPNPAAEAIPQGLALLEFLGKQAANPPAAAETTVASSRLLLLPVPVVLANYSSGSPQGDEPLHRRPCSAKSNRHAVGLHGCLSALAAA